MSIETTHTPEELQKTAQRVFVTRESTLEQEAADHGVSDLKRTVVAVRRGLRGVAVNLPDSAYEEQPDDADGNEVWSAGEIISHIAGSTIWTDNNVRTVLGLNHEPPGDEISAAAEMKPRRKADAMAALDAADRKLQVVFDIIQEDGDSATTIDHERFGTIGVKGWLLMTAVHEADHTRQLRELGESLQG